MGEGSNQFRGSTFGGFNRQDVLNYLAEIETEHDKIMAGLRAELEDVKRGSSEDKKQIKELEDQLKSEEGSKASLQEEMKKLEAEHSKKMDALKQTEEELSRMKATVAELEPKALAYGRIKDRAAAIELDAHERAQHTLDQAKQEAAAMQADCERWILKVQAQYESLRSGLRETFTKSTEDLEQICQLFERIAGDFDEHEATVLALRSRVKEMKEESEETIAENKETFVL
jgi:chromosome segregation ATPase